MQLLFSFLPWGTLGNLTYLCEYSLYHSCLHRLPSRIILVQTTFNIIAVLFSLATRTRLTGVILIDT